MTESESSKRAPEEAEEDQRVLAALVTKKASLKDLRMRDVSAKLLSTGAAAPLTPILSVSPRIGRVDDYVVCDLVYKLTAKDASGVDVCDARMILNLVFTVKELDSFDRNALEAFAKIAAVDIAHPYVREIVHSLTFRMGLPAFVLDISPPRLLGAARSV